MKFFESALYNIGFFTRLLKGIKGFIQARGARKTLIMQIYFTFLEALLLSSLLALGIGAVVNMIGIPFLASLSRERLIYTLLILIITRELGPLLTAFIIIARSATAIATEIAGMVISHEIEAYISIGADPIEYLAVPRFLGVTISLFMLNIFFNIFGLAGSYAVAQFFTPLPASVYFGYLLESLTLPDLLISVIKSIVFGIIISVVALTRGLAVDRASTEIPVAGLKAVGASFGWCIILDALLSGLYYMLAGI